MQSRLIINLCLLVFIVGAVLFLNYTKEDAEEITPTLVSEISAETINHIRIERPEKDPVEFRKEDEHWKMVSPYQVTANPKRIEAILNLLSSESTTQLSVNDIDIGRLGLNTPEVTVTLNDEPFNFGDVNPLDKKRYLMHNNTVHLIHDNLFPQITTSPTFFIETKLFSEDQQITRVQYPQLRLLKNDQRWQLESELNVDDEQIQLLGRSWQNLNASNVQKYSGLESLYNFEVTFLNGETISLEVISDLPSLVLARPEQGIQYVIPEYLSQNLFPREKNDEVITQ